MKARSESNGNKCFKCGQEGHWAKKCKGTCTGLSVVKEKLIYLSSGKKLGFFILVRKKSGIMYALVRDPLFFRILEQYLSHCA